MIQRIAKMIDIQQIYASNFYYFIALAKIHKKKLFNTEVISVKNLQSEEAE